MKQKITKYLLSLNVLIAIFASHTGLVIAQTSPNNAFNTSGKSLYTIPSSAVVGSTAERRNAYNNLSESEKAQVNAKAEEFVKNAVPAKPTDVSIKLSFVDSVGNNSEISSRASVDDSSDFFGRVSSRVCQGCPSTPPLSGDADSDGLTDNFENSLADGFTPFYFVSGGENAGTGFARFNNSVPQTVSQVFGSTPPISHFRVKPLGTFTKASDGIQYGLIQINYHTLWNKDDGTVGSPYCIFQPVIDLTSLGSHNLDNEYSVVLVAAPIVNSTYDSNLQNYKIYEVYTAAHEGTFFDQSRYYKLQTPYPFGSHIKLALSRSKHATYTFDPDYFPLTPRYIIISAYYNLDAAFNNGAIDYYRYLAILAIYDSTFFGCAIDRFQDQGGVFANTRINVGELNLPINGSNFIQDTELSNQLDRYFYQ